MRSDGIQELFTLTELTAPSRSRRFSRILAALALLAAVLLFMFIVLRLTFLRLPDSGPGSTHRPSAIRDDRPRDPNFDSSGYVTIMTAMAQLRPWPETATLDEVAASYAATPDLIKQRAEERLAASHTSSEERLRWTL